MADVVTGHADVDRLMKIARRVEREGKKGAAEMIYSAANEIALARNVKDKPAAAQRLEFLFKYYFVSAGVPFSHVANVIVNDPTFLQAMGLAGETGTGGNADG